jgi:hypothetical protein
MVTVAASALSRANTGMAAIIKMAAINFRSMRPAQHLRGSGEGGGWWWWLGHSPFFRKSVSAWS